jgi:hypothetical protein
MSNTGLTTCNTRTSVRTAAEMTVYVALDTLYTQRGNLHVLNRLKSRTASHTNSEVVEQVLV